MPRHLTIQCAWCGVTMREGDPGADVSHGVCPACEPTLLASVPPVPRGPDLRARFARARRLVRQARVQAARAPFARPIGVIRQEGRHA